MGACFSSDDVQAKYSVGQASMGANEGHADAQEALSLLTGSAAYTSWLELQVSCSKLRDRDYTSKSDPMAVLHIEDGGNWRELGRTEVITNTLDPVFVKKFRVQYNFERATTLKITVVDADTQNKDPATCDLSRIGDGLGKAEFSLHSLVTAPSRTVALKLNKGGEIKVKCEEVSNAKELLTFTLSAKSLKNADTFSKSDPFVEISRVNEDGSWTPVFKTEVKNNNLNPTWNPVNVKAVQLNNGDPQRALRLRVLDYDSNGSHKVLGSLECTALQLQAAAQEGTPFQLAPGPNNGTLSVSNFSVAVQPTFLDYIQAGVEIGFMVAVDFTASNGPPSDPRSLHYVNPAGGPTAYEEAIMGVGRVLEFYDSDRIFQVTGFGGQRQGGPVSHCFPLNDAPGGSVSGIQGILNVYRVALSTWALSGPTAFAPTIEMAMQEARRPTPHVKYNVLLILTDGEIMDMDRTVASLVEASPLPLSVLIVGIGNAGFAAMNRLDGDGKRLEAHGRKAVRDIVQFVEFRRFRNDGNALAAELLAELPGQFLAWTRANNVPLPAPRPPA